MQCANCGQQVPDTANVCGYCGHRLKSAASRPPSPAVSAPSPKPVVPPVSVQALPISASAKKGISGWVWALGGCGLVVVLIGICALVPGINLFAPPLRTDVVRPTDPPEPVVPQQNSIPTVEIAPTSIPAATALSRSIELFTDDELIDESSSLFWEVTNSAFSVNFDNGLMIFDLFSAGYRYQLGVSPNSDYWIASRAAKLDPDDTASFGFIFMPVDADTFSVLEIVSNGDFAVINVLDGDYEVIQDWVTFPHAASTDYVEFEAFCERGILSVIVNRIPVDGIAGSNCDVAEVGLFGYAYDGMATVAFDYFRYGELK